VRAGWRGKWQHQHFTVPVCAHTAGPRLSAAFQLRGTKRQWKQSASGHGTTAVQCSRELTLPDFRRKLSAMPSNFDEAFAAVQSLAKDFDAQKDFYLSPKYQEAEVRKEFIDKFLIALGWDVNHDRQKNPYEQEVKIERKEHGISQRRADYAFYLAPNFRDVKFYIEAKKPFGDIATPDNYFQTIRYGWNSQTPVAALFDFEQFEIVDCRFKPDLESALQRNLKKFHYRQYTDKEKFAEIYWLFSREAVAGCNLLE
jgi:hypothetical protein